MSFLLSLKSLDILGEDITFNYNGSNKTGSKLGGGASVILAILLALLIVGFGQDFFKRTNPNVIRESKDDGTVSIFNITNHKLSLAFRVMYGDLVSVRDYTGVYINTYLYQYKKVKGDWVPVTQGKKFELVKCTEDMVSSKEEFVNSGFENYLCPIFDNTTLGGIWGASEYVGYFYLDVVLCKDGMKNNDGQDCQSEEETNKLINNDTQLYFSQIVPQTVATPTNYHKGIRTSYSMEYFRLSSQLTKVYYYFFIETIMKTDYGWILKDERIDSLIGLNKVKYDYNLRNAQIDNILATTIYYFGRETDVYRREYSKIQTLSANIGGILKLFIMFFQFLVSYYNRKIFESQMGNYVQSSAIESKDISNTKIFKSFGKDYKDNKIIKDSKDGKDGKDGKFNKNSKDSKDNNVEFSKINQSDQFMNKNFINLNNNNQENVLSLNAVSKFVQENSSTNLKEAIDPFNTHSIKLLTPDLLVKLCNSNIENIDSSLTRYSFNVWNYFKLSLCCCFSDKQKLNLINNKISKLNKMLDIEDYLLKSKFKEIVFNLLFTDEQRLGITQLLRNDVKVN